MAYDTAIADTMQADLGILPGLSEKKMFGGICFLLHDHMVCAVHSRGAMYRVGKDRLPDALALGAQPMSMGTRVMGGWADLDPDTFQDGAIREALTGLALAHVATLPAKG